MLDTDITFQAGEEIVLSPGFEASAGCQFVAKIATCPSARNGSATNNSAAIARNNATLVEDSTLKMDVSPNPAQANSILNYNLPKDQFISITINELKGQEVKRLTYNEWQLKGPQSISLELQDLVPGTYFLRLRTAEHIAFKKIIVQ